MDGAALGSLSQRFSTRGDPLTPRGQLRWLWLPRCGGGDATGIVWVEVRDAAKHPTGHRTAPTAKNDPA